MLNRDSREAKTKVTRPARARSTMGRSDSGLARSSLKYLVLNYAHLSGSWLNQRPDRDLTEVVAGRCLIVGREVSRVVLDDPLAEPSLRRIDVAEQIGHLRNLEFTGGDGPGGLRDLVDLLPPAAKRRHDPAIEFGERSLRTT